MLQLEGEKLAVGSDQLIEGEWNHLALVVNRMDGEIRHFLKRQTCRRG